MFTDKAMLTIQEAALYMRICEKTLRNVYLKIEGFPWMQPAGKGGKILIPRIPLDQWICDNWHLYQEA